MPKHHKIYNSKLRNKTKSLLTEWLKLKANTLTKIEQDTGLSSTWIAMLDRGQINHSDVGRIEALYNYLSPTQLEV